MGGVESPTEVMNTAEMAAIERWAEGHRSKPRGQGQGQMVAAPLVQAEPQPPTELVIPGDSPAYPPPSTAPGAPASVPSTIKVEAGLRVCPRCGRPVHLGAENCRQCGAPVPRREFRDRRGRDARRRCGAAGQASSAWIQM
jgi:ribosomal protein L40E